MTGTGAGRNAVSCTRFPWTAICPTGDRHGEVEHERDRTRECGGWAGGHGGRAQPVHAVHGPGRPAGRGRDNIGPAGAWPALERGAQARGRAAAHARRVRRVALPRTRRAGVQARAVAAQGRSRARGGAERARGRSGRRPTRRGDAADRGAEHGERAAAGPHWPPRPFGPREVAVTAAATSPATGRRYGVARVCGAWEVPRSSFYAARVAADGTRPPASPARRGPKPAVPDADLLAAIRADLARSPWTGEGHRKVWARLRALDGVRVSRKRVLRLMRE